MLTWSSLRSRKRRRPCQSLASPKSGSTPTCRLRIAFDRLITHRFHLDQAVEAFQEFDKGETGKCVFVA
jgi:hypothetical protein